MKIKNGFGEQGFSLVELIIVIAILAILTGGVGYGLSSLEAADAKKCAYNIKSGIGRAKSETMSKTKPTNLFLYRYDGDYYLKYSQADSVTLDNKGEDIGGSRTTIEFDDGSSLSDGNVRKISLARKDGSFTEGPITITVSGNSTYTLKLIHSTGKYFIE